MDNKAKEILIDLVEYYRTLKYAKDIGHIRLEHLAKRATQVLDSEKARQRKRSCDVDPFAMDVVSTASSQLNLNLKHESEW